MIGNFDWCLKFAPDDIYRCNEPKPLWNVLAFDRGDGKAALLIKDFDLAGIVAGRHGWFSKIFNPAFVSSRIRDRDRSAQPGASERDRSSPRGARCAASQLRGSASRRSTPPSSRSDVDAKGREVARTYLDRFFAAIADDQSSYRPVVVKSDVRVYIDAEQAREACKPGDLVRPGTPVNELQRSGSMSQVVILDALWRWTAERRCETVQTSPVWIQSDAIGTGYPSKN